MKQTEKKKITGVVVFTYTVIITNLKSGVRYRGTWRAGSCVENASGEMIDHFCKKCKDGLSEKLREMYPKGEFSFKITVSRRVTECTMVCLPEKTWNTH